METTDLPLAEIDSPVLYEPNYDVANKRPPSARTQAPRSSKQMKAPAAVPQPHRQVAQLVPSCASSSGTRPAPVPPYNATVVPRHNGSEMVARSLAARPWWRETPAGESFDFWWSASAFDWTSFHSRSPHAPRALTNRIKGNSAIVNKDKLAVNLRKYVRAAKVDAATASSLLPLTFVVHVQLTDETQTAESNELKPDFELVAFREAAQAARQRGEGSMWICKSPPLNRGRGIYVFKTPRAVEQFLKKRALASRKNRTWVVQKYLETPLLLGGRKFDIRMLVLVTADHRVYMYRDSYVRTASSAYDASNTKDSAIHLVNDAVQSQGDEYGKFEDANKLSFDELQALLDALPLAVGRVLSDMSDLWPAMKGAVSHVFSCAQHQHFVPTPPGAAMFELFGLDFMVDDAGRVSLLEVNSGPALCRHGRVLEKMIPRLIEEVVQLAVDPLFPPPEGAQPPTPLHRFELVDVPPSPLATGAACNLAKAASSAVIGAAAAAAATANPAAGFGKVGTLPRMNAKMGSVGQRISGHLAEQRRRGTSTRLDEI